MTSSDLALVAVAAWAAFVVLVLGLDRLSAGPGARPRLLRFLVNDRGDEWEPVAGYRHVDTTWTIAGTFEPDDWNTLVALDQGGVALLAEPEPGVLTDDPDDETIELTGAGDESDPEQPHLVLIPGFLGVDDVESDPELTPSILQRWVDDDWADEVALELVDDELDEHQSWDGFDPADSREDTPSAERVEAPASESFDAEHLEGARQVPGDLDIELALDISQPESTVPVRTANDQVPDPFFADLIRRLSDQVGRDVNVRANAEPRTDVSDDDAQPANGPATGSD